MSRHQRNQGVLLSNNSNGVENIDFNNSSSNNNQIHAIRSLNSNNFYPSQNNNLQRVVREEFNNLRSPNEQQKGLF